VGAVDRVDVTVGIMIIFDTVRAILQNRKRRSFEKNETPPGEKFTNGVC